MGLTYSTEANTEESSEVESNTPTEITEQKEMVKEDVKREVVSLRKYGWKKDLPDKRDKYHSFSFYNPLPTTVDLRDKCPPVYNQEKLGSCTANAIAAAYEFDQVKQGEKNAFLPSRLFIYYNEREKEGHTDTDCGAEIRDGIKSINKQGVCPESMWPYNTSEFTTKPTTACYQTALNHRAIRYKKVIHDLSHLKACLKSGLPFVFGFAVYESFEDEEVSTTGVMSIPSPGEKMLGGHAVMAVGYDDSQKHFIVRNSWGQEWGDQGYFYMPYEFIVDSDYCSDFWTVKRVRDVSTQNSYCTDLAVQTNNHRRTSSIIV